MLFIKIQQRSASSTTTKLTNELSLAEYAKNRAWHLCLESGSNQVHSQILPSSPGTTSAMDIGL